MESVLFDIFINVVVGYAIARLVIWLFVQRLEAKLHSELETLVDRVVDGVLIPITVEVDNNQYFCYNAMTKDFVCQGYTLTEIADRFMARYPEKKIALYNGDETALATLKQQMEQLRVENEARSSS